MQEKNKTLLIVEDNVEVLRLNAMVLSREGFSILTASTIGQARSLLADHMVDLIVLDILLPDGSGLDFCEELRGVNTVPILFLTSKRESADIVKGLQMGGDDYLTKPYKIDELLARVQAQLRRSEYALQSQSCSLKESSIQCGPVSLDLDQLVAYVDGKDIGLTPKEFALLKILVQNSGIAVSTKELYQTVWGEHHPDDPRVVWTHISRLRGKLEIGPASPINITAERGRGYLFQLRQTS